MQSILPYLWNCSLLMLPILLWNLAFARRLNHALPAGEFTREAPAFVTYVENVTRLILFVTPALMPLNLATGAARTGLIIYGAGLVLYALSWIPLMYLSGAGWSVSLWGILAPAYTPIIWLTGIGVIGDSFWPGIPFLWWGYPVLSGVFVAAHVLRTRILRGRSLDSHRGKKS